MWGIIIGVIAGMMIGGACFFRCYRLLQERRTTNAKMVSFYRCMNRWIYALQIKADIITFFHENNYKRVAIYGIKELGDRLYQQLEDTDITVKYFIDKNKDNVYWSRDIPLVSPQETIYDADVIIVTAIYYYNEIRDELEALTQIPVYSLTSVIDRAITKRKEVLDSFKNDIGAYISGTNDNYDYYVSDNEDYERIKEFLNEINLSYPVNSETDYFIVTEKDKKDILGVCPFVSYSKQEWGDTIDASVGDVFTSPNHDDTEIDTLIRIQMRDKLKLRQIISVNCKRDFNVYVDYYDGKVLTSKYYIMSNQTNDAANWTVIEKSTEIDKIFYIDRFEEIEGDLFNAFEKGRRPYKDEAFIKKWYMEKQGYKYLYVNEDMLMVLREENILEKKALHIVDILGNLYSIRRAGLFLKKELERYDYIDCISYGIDEELMRKSGFICINSNLLSDENLEDHYCKTYNTLADVCGCVPGNAILFLGDIENIPL